MEILTLPEIEECIDLPRIIEMQEQGFRAFSDGKVNLPPVGYLKQMAPPGAYHIKYGLIEDDSLWVCKIVGGPLNQPSSGMMVVISQETGKPVALLQEDGYLTKLRTAVAGLISAKYLAPEQVTAIGVFGTGTQARMQVDILTEYTFCRDVYVWGRTEEKVNIYKSDMEEKGFNVRIASSPAEVALHCNLLITATNAREAFLNARDIQPGTHITAMGADSPGKIELDPAIITKADIVVVDSKAQCIDHGEICHAFNKDMIAEEELIELGEIIASPKCGRNNNEQITVVDLTGLAVQDIQIATAVINAKCVS